MRSKEIKGAKELELNIQFDDSNVLWKENCTYEYEIRERVLYISNEDIYYAARILKDEYDLIEVLRSDKEKLLLRLDRYDEKKNIGFFTIMVFYQRVEFSEPYQIILDEDVYREIFRLYPQMDYQAAVKYLQIEYIYRNQDKKFCFGYANDSIDGALCLVGRTTVCVIEKSVQDYFHITGLYKKRNINEILTLITGDIAFQDNREIIKQNSKDFNKKYNELVRNSSELIKLWKIYDQLDLESVKQDALYLGYLKYKSYHRRHGDFVFELDNAYVPREFLQENMQYAVIQSAVFNTDDPLNYDNRCAITIGSQYYKDCANSPEFRIQDDMVDTSRAIPSSGYIIPSLNGSIIQSQRREKAQKRIMHKDCPMTGMKLLLQNGDCVGTIGKRHKPITEQLNKYIFGTSDRSFNERQKEAIDIAINTPDVAVIQGPPGTGKTKVIKAIVERLNEIYDGKLKLLITSTQHDAVDNAARDVDYGGVPVNRVGFKNKNFNDNSPVYEWIDNMIDQSSDWLSKHEPTNEFEDIHNTLEKIRNLKNVQDLPKELYGLSNELKRKGCSVDLIKYVDSARNTIFDQLNKAMPSSENGDILWLLDQQKTNVQEFLSEGLKPFKQLKIFLDGMSGNIDFVVPGYWIDLRKAKSNTANLEDMLMKFKKDLDKLRNIFTTCSEGSNEDIFDFKEYISNFINHIKSELAKSSSAKTDEELLYDCIWQFKHELSNTANVKNLISAYSKVNAATCQQSASRSLNIAMQGFEETYDYVIIDEAARSNPLDLLIPMSMGRKVVLVGDHKQLPHMVEMDIVKAVAEKTKNEEAYQVLEESLFMRLFQNLKRKDDEYRSNPETKINISRTCTLNEQFRMHPAICDLINVFYNEEHLISGCSEEEKDNNLSRYDKKPLVWIDVPISDKNQPELKGISKARPAEVDVIKEELEHILFENNTYDIGIITFYRKQACLLEDMVSREFPNERNRISIGTVDAFQGKEFDVVLLSTVRANNEIDKKKRVGFLDNNNRLCVAFSRAKRVLVAVGDSNTVANSNGKVIIDSLNELYKRGKDEYGFFKSV